ncbi:MAG: hypothetical protein IKO32_02610 [Lachnospiraceae bacterium]|nr:hypothetical protein [Lachnospiraceae bacterium]
MKEIFFGNKNTGTKRIFILFVSFVALFLFFPVYAKASPIYTPVNAQVPFQCRKPDADKDISYTIIMDTISSNAPLPKDSKLSLAGGQNGNFEISVTEPGTYVYRVGQKKGAVEKAIYDEKEYDVFLYVINDNGAGLDYTLSVVERNTDIKPDSIVFSNRFEEEKKDDPPAADEPSKPADTPAQNVSVTDMVASKTGENNALYIGLYILVLLGLTAGAGAYVAAKKSKTKEEV